MREVKPPPSSPATFEQRRQRMSAWMDSQGIDLLVIEDCEGRRNPNLPYLSGHPMDALLFLYRDGRSVLVAWDEHLARLRAAADEILPYNEFKRDLRCALLAMAARGGTSAAGRSGAALTIEINRMLPHPLYENLAKALSEQRPAARLVCRTQGADDEIERMRMIKDEAEIALYREACAATDRLLAMLSAFIQDAAAAGTSLSETDVALYIERESRCLGAEGTSFDTIAAGPERSWAIHAVPSYGAGPFFTPCAAASHHPAAALAAGSPASHPAVVRPAAAHPTASGGHGALRSPVDSGAGLSILDFGLRWNGYATDVTFTTVSGRPNSRQETMINLVEAACALVLERCRPGLRAYDLALAVEELFSAHGFKMPHSLGHGIGLDVHEAPVFRLRDDNDFVLEAGMILAMEPGLYDPCSGGVRKENDILITPSGCEALTSSRILRLG